MEIKDKSINNDIKIERVTTHIQADKVADLYISYYKQKKLNKEEFLKRWNSVNKYENHYMYTAHMGEKNTYVGFLNFTIVPSIFWDSSLIRIDSLYIKDIDKEIDISKALFKQMFIIMESYKISVVNAVSCDTYEQEIRILKKYLSIDQNPYKTFFTKVI